MNKTLIVYVTKTGINSDVAHTMAETLETKYDMDITIADLKDGRPDIAPFQNIIVGGGVYWNYVYPEAVDFLAQNFENKNVAIYFTCEGSETPKEEDTEANAKKALAKNPSLKPIDVAAFGGCVVVDGKAGMDNTNVDRVKDWAIDFGKKVGAPPHPLKQIVTVKKEPVVELHVDLIPAAEMPPASELANGFFEVWCDEGKKFRFHLKAGNGEIIAVSQGYETKAGAVNGIASIKKNASMAKVVDRTTAGILA
jgi:uncharacterized protein YegP (UPF0339 family)/menaquinone-dependent protoporphyrinogen IX oxidase